MSIVEVKETKNLMPLFRSHRYDTVVMRSVLEGHFGHAYADSLDNPTVARLDSGAFTVLGGDPDSPLLSALLNHRPISIVTPENNQWRTVLEGKIGKRFRVLPFTEFFSSQLKASHLTSIVQTLPEGYQLVKISADYAQWLPEDLGNEYFFENFVSIADFLKRGIGYCIVHNGKVVSAATSMAMCNNAIDIEIETAAEFQRQGLGVCVGARLLLACLEKGIEPKWLAANAESERLALKLGFKKGETYETLELTDLPYSEIRKRYSEVFALEVALQKPDHPGHHQYQGNTFNTMNNDGRPE